MEHTDARIIGLWCVDPSGTLGMPSGLRDRGSPSACVSEPDTTQVKCDSKTIGKSIVFFGLFPSTSVVVVESSPFQSLVHEL